MPQNDMPQPEMYFLFCVNSKEGSGFGSKDQSDRAKILKDMISRSKMEEMNHDIRI